MLAGFSGPQGRRKETSPLGKYEIAALGNPSKRLSQRRPLRGTLLSRHTACLSYNPLVEALMLFMVIEHFRNEDAKPVYRRFREQGRMAPEGLMYVLSWVTSDLTRCYQVMECEDRRLLDLWMTNWEDLVEFEVIPVITSAEASARA